MGSPKPPADGDDRTVREDLPDDERAFTNDDHDPTLIEDVSDDHVGFAETVAANPSDIADHDRTVLETGDTGDERTIAIPGEQDERTVALPQPGDDDRTIAMDDPGDVDDRTMAMDQPGDADATVNMPQGDGSTDATIADPAEGWGAESFAPPADVSGDAATVVADGSGDADDLHTVISQSVADVEKSAATPVRHLERFELERVLGQGAFGTVYLARDPQLDRRVAIKVARTGVLQSKSDIDRFKREACAAAQLRHPNIVPVYEVGEVGGSTYIVYEYVEGTTLKGLLKQRGKLSPEDAVSMMIRVADALDYAHSHGIVHRDMKPDNILLDDAGDPHIADFGLARREEQDATQTREGTLMGTPAYMSPEQAAGQVSKVDKRSDVWALGIMLDEMLTSRRPFSGTVVEVLRAVQEQTIKPLRATDPSLPVDLETICLKALEREQVARFQTAQEMADELRRWSRGEPITLRRISVLERVWRWAKRNQTVAILLATLFVTLTLGTVISTMFGLSASNTAAALRESRDTRVRQQLQRVLTAEPGAVSTLLTEVARLKTDTPGLLQNALEADANPDKPARKPLLVKRLASGDSSEYADAVDELQSALLATVDPREFLLLREELEDEKQTLTPGLWAVVKDENADDAARLRAAGALAQYDPGSDDWSAVSDTVVSRLLANRLALTYWVRALEPVRDELRASLLHVFDSPTDPNRQAAAAVLGALHGSQPELLARLVNDADPDQLAELMRQFDRLDPEALQALVKRLGEAYQTDRPNSERDIDDRQRANHVIALLEAGQLRRANEELTEAERNGVRSYVIERAGVARLRKQVLLRYLREESDPGLLRTAILALANYGEADLDRRERTERSRDLLRLYRTHPDAGVHSAVDWLMRRWGFADELNAAAAELRSSDWPTDGRRWHHTPSGMVFAIFHDPAEFRMGTDDPTRGELFVEERPHRRTIKRSFAISLHEVTIGQYRRWKSDYRSRNPEAGDSHPATRVRWYEAAQFCVWLTGAEKFDSAENCYEPGANKNSVKVRGSINTLHGYRLPTSAEWEFASRGGTSTTRHFGSGTSLLGKYAWTAAGASITLRPVAQLKPNEVGLFDSLGNASEWCQNWYDEAEPAGNDLIDGEEGEPGKYVFREYRPASVEEVADNVVDAARGGQGEPTGPVAFISDSLGFRIARTLPE